MENNLIELRKANGKKGPNIPFLKYLNVSDFIVATINEKVQITLFDLIDKASSAFKDGPQILPVLLAVKEDLLAKKIIKIDIIRGRNQVLELTKDFKKNKTLLVTPLNKGYTGVYFTF